jgi:hypothetical protein
VAFGHEQGEPPERIPGLLTATRTGPSPAGDDELMLDQLPQSALPTLGRTPQGTTNRSPARPNSSHPMHRHDVGASELAIAGSSSTVAFATRQIRQSRLFRARSRKSRIAVAGPSLAVRAAQMQLKRFMSPR